MNSRLLLKLIAILSARFLFPPSRRFGVGCGRLAASAISLTLAVGLMGMFLVPAARGGTAFWNWTSGTRNWSTAGNWTPGVPNSTNDVIFGNTDAQAATTPVNTVTASITVKSLSYTNSSASAYTSYQNTTLASGQILTITNGLTVGVPSSTSYAADPFTYATLTGAGAVLVTGGNVQIGINSGSPTPFVQAMLDMRGLTAFVYNNSAGTFSVAGAGVRRQGGEVYLAGTNSITASALSLGISASGVGANPGKLHLGATNNLFADTITVAKIISGGMIDFQTGLNNPVVNIRGKNGVSGVANWYVGWNSTGNAANNGVGTNDFSGGILNAAVTNLYLGLFDATAGSGTRAAAGTFTIGTNAANSLVVQNLFVGAMTSASSLVTYSTVGNFSVIGGTVTAGTVTLAQRLGSGAATGNLRLNDATMQVTGNVVAGGGTNTISVSNATLTVVGRIGLPTSIIGTNNLNQATLGLTLIAPGNYTQAAASVGTLNIDGASGSTVLKINNASPTPGQYPLIGYTNIGGAAGFGGLSVQVPGFRATLSNNVSSFPYTVDVVISDVLSWDGLPTGDWDIAGTANWKSGASSVTYNETAGVGDRVRFDDAATGTRTVNLTTTLSPTTVTVSNTAGDYVFNGIGKITGPTGLSKSGNGMLTITTTNDYTGVTAISGGILRIGHGSALGDPAINTTISGGSSTTLRLELMGDITVAEKLSLNGKSGSSPTHVANVSGTNTLTGLITAFSGGSVYAFRSDAGKLIVNAFTTDPGLPVATRTLRLYGSGNGDWAANFPAGPSGSTFQVRKEGTGTWTLSAFNSYTYETRVNEGTLLVNGTISSTTNVVVGDTTTPTVSATLGGTGIISGPVTVNTNGTLAPGASIGTLTIYNTLTNLGTNVFEVNNDTLAHDTVIGLISVTYGGTLVISPSGGGTAFTNGATMQLFSAASYSGAFDAIIPAAPAPGLAWDTSQLTVTGTLGIGLGVNTTPTNLVFSLTGNALEISWPADRTGWRLEGQTNSINTGLSNNWFTLPGSTTTNQVTLPVNPANGAVFYRLVYP